MNSNVIRKDHETLLRLLLESLGLDEENEGRVLQILLNPRNIKTHSPEYEKQILNEILREAKNLEANTQQSGNWNVNNNNNSRSNDPVVKIQRAARNFLIRKRLAQLMQYHRPRVAILREMITKENDYNKFLSILAQHFSVPLLNTNDLKLKDDCKDIREILFALVDIEILHRKLLRKFRWFVEEGCDWPNIDGIGKLFLDMSEEFKVYGTFVNHFKYAIDILDLISENPNERPKLYQYFCEKAAQHNFGFKALLSKPLNQMASYELGLHKLAEITSPEKEDFKCTMNALSIIRECNKYMNTCIVNSENIARIKLIEQKLVLNKKDPYVDKLYLECISSAQFIDSYMIELSVRRAMKKKASGQLYLFNKMIGIAVLSKGSFQLKKVFKIEEFKSEIVEGSSLLLTSTLPTPSGNTPRSQSPNTNDNSIKIRFENPKLISDFTDRIKSLKEQNDKKKVFGVSLNVLLGNEENKDGVPFIIQNLCNFMLETSLETVGIFRVPGSAQVERQMVAEYNRKGGRDINLKAFNLSPNDAAGLFKLFFRELPTSLCGELFTVLVDINKRYESHNDDTILVHELQTAVKKLTKENLILFDYICKFMLKVAEKKEINKMDCSNVAMCIGPDILSPSVDSLELILLVPNANRMLGKIVQFCYEIF